MQLRQVLIQAVLDLFEEQGHAPSVDEITARAGIAKGTFYLYVRTKADIVRAVVDQGMGQLEDCVGEAEASAPVGAENALRAVVRAQLAFFEKHHAMLVLLLGGRVWTSEEIPAEMRIELRDRYRKVTAAVYERLLQEGIRQGAYRECDTRLAAHALEGIVAGLVYEAIDSDSPFTGIYTVVADLFERGVQRVDHT